MIKGKKINKNYIYTYVNYLLSKICVHIIYKYPMYFLKLVK